MESILKKLCFQYHSNGNFRILTKLGKNCKIIIFFEKEPNSYFAEHYLVLLVHHLFNKKGSLVGTKSLVHFFQGGGL